MSLILCLCFFKGLYKFVTSPLGELKTNKKTKTKQQNPNTTSPGLPVYYDCLNKNLLYISCWVKFQVISDIQQSIWKYNTKTLTNFQLAKLFSMIKHCTKPQPERTAQLFPISLRCEL